MPTFSRVSGSGHGATSQTTQASPRGCPAVGPADDRAGLRLALQRTVGMDFEAADFREHEPSILELRAVAPLRVTEGVVPAPAPEARIARLFAVPHAAEERLEGAIY